MSNPQQGLGQIDRTRFSLSEEHEVAYYVAQYIKARGYADSKENNNVLTRHVRQYPAGGAVAPGALTAWLDARLAY